MAKEKLEDLTTEKLIRRKKIGTGIVMALVILIPLYIIYFVILFVRKNVFEYQELVPALTCFAIALPMYAGIKKINEELARRNNK